MDAGSERIPPAVEVLLIEDNPYDAELILRSLRKVGLADGVVWLKDGVAALERLFGATAEEDAAAETPARLVLLDLKLPKVDGQEVLRRIKADQRMRRLPVVVLTSSREASDLLQAYDAGVNSYVVKPVDFDELTNVIRQLGVYWLNVNQGPA